MGGSSADAEKPANDIDQEVGHVVQEESMIVDEHQPPVIRLTDGLQMFG